MPDDHAAGAPGGAAAECRSCLLCQGLAALRQARPEAVEHLARAGLELLLAARALLEPPAAEPAPGAARPVPAEALRRIDVG
jgi:hypothetical protein